MNSVIGILDKRLQYQLPYEVKKNVLLGHTLVASTIIEAQSLLCEYKGQLKLYNATLQHNEYVILEKDVSQQLIVIDSTYWSNESRLIAGIPHSSNDKANCGFVRLMVNQVPRAFVYTLRRIEVNEVLYIDYGDEWDTSTFVYIKYMTQHPTFSLVTDFTQKFYQLRTKWELIRGHQIYSEKQITILVTDVLFSLLENSMYYLQHEFTIPNTRLRTDIAILHKTTHACLFLIELKRNALSLREGQTQLKNYMQKLCNNSKQITVRGIVSNFHNWQFFEYNHQSKALKELQTMSMSMANQCSSENLQLLFSELSIFLNIGQNRPLSNIQSHTFSGISSALMYFRNSGQLKESNQFCSNEQSIQQQLSTIDNPFNMNSFAKRGMLVSWKPQIKQPLQYNIPKSQESKLQLTNQPQTIIILPEKDDNKVQVQNQSVNTEPQKTPTVNEIETQRENCMRKIQYKTKLILNIVPRIDLESSQEKCKSFSELNKLRLQIKERQLQKTLAELAILIRKNSVRGTIQFGSVYKIFKERNEHIFEEELRHMLRLLEMKNNVVYAEDDGRIFVI